MIVCSRSPHHHLKDVGESHPTRSHLTSFGCLENHHERHFGSNPLCGCGHSAGQCLLFALRASFVHTQQHWQAEVLWKLWGDEEKEIRHPRGFIRLSVKDVGAGWFAMDSEATRLVLFVYIYVWDGLRLNVKIILSNVSSALTLAMEINGL